MKAERRIAANWSVVALAAFFLFAAAAAPAQVQWLSNVDQALHFASQSNKPVFVYFHKRSVDNCLRLEQNTLLHPSVGQFLGQNFLCAQVNADIDPAAVGRFGVYRVPMCIVLDKSGREYTRLLTYHNPEEFVTALTSVQPIDPQSIPVSSQVRMPNEIYRQSFDSLYGWGNDGSVDGNTLQFSLVKGVRGRAFAVDYQLQPKDWNYVQFTLPLEEGQRFTLPNEYTVVFQVSGKGGANALDVKFVDGNGTNYGATLPIPTDFSGHQYVLTSREIKHLWGGDEELTEIMNLQFAITPDGKTWETTGINPEGTLYLDELIIVPGIKTDIRRDNPVQH